MNSGMLGMLSYANLAIIAFFVVLLIYCLVLFIKLAQKGMRALDIYIRNNEKKINRD